MLRERRAVSRRGAATVALIALLYLGVGVFDHEVWSPTEPAVAGVVWNMIEHGSLAVPRINDFPYLEKPPGYYWLAWLAVRASGRLGAGWLRLPAAGLGLLALGLFYAVVRRRHGREVALVAVLVAATTFELYQMAHRATTDIAAIASASLCFAIFTYGMPRPGEGPDPRPLLRDVALALALAVSFYAKNFFTFLIVLPPIGAFLLLRRRFLRLARLGLLTGVLTVAVLAPWAAALHAAGGAEYLRIVFVDNTVGRFLTLSTAGMDLGPLNDAYGAEKDSSALVYLTRLPLLPMPWTLLLAAAVVALFRRREDDDLRLFLGVALVAVPVVLSLSSSRATNYLDPMLFLVFLAIAELLADLGRATAFERGLAAANAWLVGVGLALAPAVLALRFREVPWCLPAAILPVWWLARKRGRLSDWRSAHTFGCAVAVACVALLLQLVPRLDASKASTPFFREIAPRIEGRELHSAIYGDRRLPLINYYLGRRVPIVYDDEEVLALLSSGRPVAVFVRPGFVDAQRERLAHTPHDELRGEGGKQSFVLLVNP
jgi:4-amino-4-deoxy-L-arabinose transferase-like glycosyltransferase